MEGKMWTNLVFEFVKSFPSYYWFSDPKSLPTEMFDIEIFMIRYFSFKSQFGQLWATGPQHIAKLTNLMNLSFDRKSKLEIHKPRQKVPTVCFYPLPDERNANKRAPFFLPLCAQQSFGGQKGREKG